MKTIPRVNISILTQCALVVKDKFTGMKAEDFFPPRRVQLGYLPNKYNEYTQTGKVIVLGLKYSCN